MKKVCIALIFLFLQLSLQSVFSQNHLPIEYNNHTIEKSETYKKGNIYQRDFLLYLDLLRTVHPAFADCINPPFDIDSLQIEGYKKLQECSDFSNFGVYLQQIASKLHDGHTVIQSIIEDMSCIYPFSYEQYDNAFYIRTISREHQEYLGEQIIAINEVPIKEVIDSFRSNVSAETRISANQHIQNYAINMYLFWKYKSFAHKDSSIVLSLNNGKTINMRPISRNNMDLVYITQNLENKQIKRNNNQLFDCSFDYNKSIGYLQLNKCEDQLTQRIMLNMRGVEISDEAERKLREIPYFYIFLRDFFTHVYEFDIKNIVIDVRNNPGGNSLLTDQLLSWLCDIRKMLSFQTYVRISPFLLNYYKLPYKDLVNSIELYYGSLNPNMLYNCQTGKSFNSDTLSGFSEEFHSAYLHTLNLNIDSIFRGNIYFIQNEKTYSSAAQLIIKAHDNKIGKILGGPSSYSTSSYGDVLVFTLPNTMIKGTVSHKLFLRPKHSLIKEAEIVPTPIIVSSKMHFNNNIDPCWEYIVRDIDNNN